MKVRFLVILASVSLIFSGQFSSAGGPDIFYGGDPVIEAFQAYQNEVIRDLQRVPFELLPTPAFLQDYRRKVFETVVTVSNTPLFKDGDEYMMLNYPYSQPPRIVISRPAWEKAVLAPEKYKKLALHETLHLLGYDDSKYTISSEIEELIRFFRPGKRLTTLIYDLVDYPTPVARKAALWTLVNLKDVYSVFDLYIDEELAALVAFCGRAKLLNELSESEKEETCKSIYGFLTSYVFGTVPIHPPNGGVLAHNYSCFLRELDNYRLSIDILERIYQSLVQRGFRHNPFAPPLDICVLPL